MKLYFKYILLLVKSQLQYKASFIMTVFTQFLTPLTAFAGIYLLFKRFGNIRGWGVYEVLVCFAVTGASNAVSTCFARGFDNFPGIIRNGEFDRVLVRPRNTVIQVLGSKFDIKRIGHLIEASVILAVAINGINLSWDLVRIFTLINMIVGGTCIFAGVYILQATIAFWTVEGIEVANILTDGVREYASYPLDIYPGWVKRFLTFIIPFGCVNYLPLLSLLGRSEGNRFFFMFMPLIGVLFILPCILIWSFGVRHYKSTGS